MIVVRFRTPWAVALWLGLAAVSPAQNTQCPQFQSFAIPEAWLNRFWQSTDAEHLLALEPRALAELVPMQAGLRWVRCPACGAGEEGEPLSWSPQKPTIVTCSQCQAEFPSEQYPAKVPPAPGQPPAIPEDVVEVTPGVFHHYPYHTVAAEKQRYPDERVYLAARRDYAARDYMFKAALYAAMRTRMPGHDPRYDQLAAIVLVRYAHVYSAYATHTDQARRQPVFQGARPHPPFRAGYLTGKGDWLACLDVPIPLVLAYDLLRTGSAIEQAGSLLGEKQPRLLVERLFRDTARFTAMQPQDHSEATLLAVRGLFFAARVLDDPQLLALANDRLARFFESAFYHDGQWNDPDPAAQRRVTQLLEAWVLPLASDNTSQSTKVSPIVALARRAISVVSIAHENSELELTSWPRPMARDQSARARLYGGAVLARLSVGQGSSRLTAELDGRSEGPSSTPRLLALRVFLNDIPVLAETDDYDQDGRREPISSAAANTIMIDCLNQRERFEQLVGNKRSSDVLFFSADPELQVACFADRSAYPRTASSYKTTCVALNDRAGPLLVVIRDIAGGVLHDQFDHVATSFNASWKHTLDRFPGPSSLLSESTRFVEHSSPSNPRWFVQGPGAASALEWAALERPTQVELTSSEGTGIRLHSLGEFPALLAVGRWYDAPKHGHSVLVTRRQSTDGRAFSSQFVTVYEPEFRAGGTFPHRVGRVESEAGLTLLALNDSTTTRYLIVNQSPGTKRAAKLPDGRTVSTDGLIAVVSEVGVAVAGGTFAECGVFRAEQRTAAGAIRAQGRDDQGGWFEIDTDSPSINWESGRTLVIAHGDGTARAWTITEALRQQAGRIRVRVEEEPGFRIEPASGEAVYYQYPQTRHPGPHQARVCNVARSTDRNTGDQQVYDTLGNRRR